MKMKAVIFLLMTFIYSLSVHSACSLDRLRVNFTMKNKNSEYYWVGNLEKQLIIEVNSSDSSTDLARKLKASDADSSLFYTMSFDDSVCKNIHLNPQVDSRAVKKIAPSIAKKVDCVECVNTSHAPIAILLPSMIEMKRILDKTAGFSPEKIDLTANMIAHLFERMNRKTANANGAVFMVSLLRALDLLGLKKIDRDQLQYLTLSFKEKLDGNQFKLLQKMFSQIDSLAFAKDSAGNLKVSLSSVGAKKITILGKDIPAADQQTKEMMDKYFSKIEIENGTSMVFNDSKMNITPLKEKRNAGMTALEINSISKPSVVTIEGIKVFGQFPVIGGISVQPKELKVDIDDSTPVRANVGFKKGFIGMSYTFDLSN